MRRRILLADDSVTIQKVIELTFMDEDYEVRAVSNGDEAIQALPEVDPDIVIADVHMPGANGYEVCRSSKERKAGVPVLLLVGTFEPFDEAQARAAGADSYLKKPFDSQELLHRVADLMASATPQAAPPAPESFPELPDLSQPAQPVEEWSGFKLSPEPELSSPFSGGPSFTLEEPVLDWQAASLPDGEPMFELEEEPAPVEAAPPPAPLPLPAQESGDVFGFESEPIPAAPPFEALSPVETRFMDVERFDLPEAAAPLVSSLEETEQRLEAPAPAPAGFEPSPEPEPTVRMAAPIIPEIPAPVPVPVPAPAPAPAPLGVGRIEVADGGLSDADVDRIARRVVELLGDRAVRDVAWEVIPDLAEVVIRDRLRELESQAESLE